MSEDVVVNVMEDYMCERVLCMNLWRSCLNIRRDLICMQLQSLVYAYYFL